MKLDKAKLEEAAIQHRSLVDDAIDSESTITAWLKYVSLGAGASEVSLEAIYGCLMAWIEKHEVSYQPTREELSMGLLEAGIDMFDAGLDFMFEINQPLETLRHISAPNFDHPFFIFLSQKKAIRENIDYDYLPDLTPREAVWLAKFTDEFYNGRFYNDSTDLHSDQDSKRAIYRNYIARYNDLGNSRRPYQRKSLTQVYGKYDQTGTIENSHWWETCESPEDSIIEYIDKKYEVTDGRR